jgi:gas vesicle protein
MAKENLKREYHPNNILGVLIGVLAGGLAGALTMLLLAPQSGIDTRQQIQKRAIELRDRTTAIVGDALAEVRLDRDRIMKGGHKKIKELKKQGQELAVEQLDRVSAAAKAGKKAIQAS